MWSQEEPRNAGAWSFVNTRFENAVGVKVRRWKDREYGREIEIGGEMETTRGMGMNQLMRREREGEDTVVRERKELDEEVGVSAVYSLWLQRVIFPIFTFFSRLYLTLLLSTFSDQGFPTRVRVMRIDQSPFLL